MKSEREGKLILQNSGVRKWKKKKRSKENEENKSMKHGVSQMTANP